MRILQIHNRHQGRGGADAVLDYEASLLGAAGHEVEQFTLPPSETMGGGSLKNGLKAVWNVEAGREVGSLIARFDPDVVHVHTPFPLLSPAVFRVAARHRKPAVTTAHSYRYSCVAGTCLRDGDICEDCVGKLVKLPGIRHRCYHDSRAASSALTLGLATHSVLGTFRRDVSRFITLTDFARQLLIRDGVAAHQVVVKPNAIPDPGEAPRRQGAPSYAVFAGRLVPEKGIATLLDAWRVIGSRLPLRVAGDGPLRELVEKRAADDPTIEYVGWLEAGEMERLIAGAETVIVPSEWYEAGPPLVLLQACAAGRPVIVSDLENISETVREAGCAYRFRTGDSVALATTVISAVADIERLRDMGSHARRAYEDYFTPQRNRTRLEEIYQAAVNEARRYRDG